MSFLFCIVGMALLLASIILCAFTENDMIWKTCLVLGEIIAFLGYAPTFLKLLG